MTELGVNVCTEITFDNFATTFDIPDIIEINPIDIWDEHENVCRVSIGRANLTPEELEQYIPLFNELDRRKPFVDNMQFRINGAVLIFKLALIMKSPNQPIYDIESSQQEYTYTEIKEGI